MDEVLSLTLDEIQVWDRRDDGLAGAGHPVSALKPGVTSPGGVAVAGTEGYLFIGDGANRWERQFLGELTIPDEWFAGWLPLFEARQAEAARRGVTLRNIVVPEKQVIYARARWPDGAARGDNRPLRQLMSRLGPQAQLVYPAAELEAARAVAPSYFRHNSHWTPSGCIAATAPLLAALDSPADSQALRFAYHRLRRPQDLTVHFLDPAPTEECGWLAPIGEMVFDNRATHPPGRNSGTSYGVRNDAAPDPRKLILFGDSFALDEGLTGALSAVFAQVTFVWSKVVDWDLVAQHGAELVVWESAERFLATVPQA
jgi:alginate O-acetyltransferase complex protein AlgJ